jgi:hypothetical protein
MAVWDDLIDFDAVGDWPIELAGWLKLLEAPFGQEQRARVEQLVRECLQVSRIRTYHCTRLLASEVEAIKREGLRLPSTGLARDKREAANAAGRPVPFWAQDSPSDKIWFYHRRADLDAGTAGAFLRSWGGMELLATSRGVVDSAAKPYITAFDHPIKELNYVSGISWCRLETKIINQYLAQSSPVTPQDTAFESYADRSVQIEVRDIIPARDMRFSALTNYCDERHFHAA